jgi:hypothetical protein
MLTRSVMCGNGKTLHLVQTKNNLLNHLNKIKHEKDNTVKVKGWGSIFTGFKKRH